MNPRPITHGHLWLVFALPSFTSCKAGVSSRLQRAVSVAGIAPRFLQRSIRGSVSGRYPFIPLLGVSVRKAVPFRHFYLFAGKSHAEFVCDNVSLHYQKGQDAHRKK